MGEAVLSLSNVVKHYGSFRAVDNVSLAIDRGCVYGLLGPNGAGKTTTIRMILDIIRPSSGQIRVLGQSSALAVRHRIGYLPEEKGLYQKMKAWAVIQYFAMLKGMDRAAAKRRALELLERYGLAEFTETRVEALSKGMAQKVQVMCAVAHEPDLVILDEPFSGLDPVNQAVLENLIRDLAANGQTVIFSTHVMQHAERLCDHILLIAGGRKVFDGTLAQARATMPRRVVLATADDPAPLGRLPGVAEIRALPAATGTPPVWQLSLDEQLDPQQVLRQCFELGINLSRFESAEPSLHDVFVQLVGTQARPGPADGSAT